MPSTSISISATAATSPGRALPEDAARESAAAVAGGITCFIPYLMTSDPFARVLPEVIGVTEAGSRIDFGYHPIISTETQLAEVEACAREHGAPTFKIFMNNRGGEGARLGLPDIDDGFLLRLCEAAARAGGMVCPHPETIELAWVTRERARRRTRTAPGGSRPGTPAGRPSSSRCGAAGGFHRPHGRAPLYVVHTSSARPWLRACANARRARSSSSRPARTT